jgi:hypothetical protein
MASTECLGAEVKHAEASVMCIGVVECLKHRIGAVIDLYKREVNIKRGELLNNVVEIQTCRVSARVAI